MRRLAGVTVAVLGILVILAVTLVWALTNTDVGRDRVRRIGVSVLNSVAHGHVSIGRLDGNLLHEIIAGDVTIADSAGAPFVAVRRVSARYSLRDLFHKRLSFRTVRVDHPLVVLDEYAPKHWNFDRIFPSSKHPSSDTTSPGWGSWIAATDVRVTDGRFVLRRWAQDSQQVLTADSITTSVPRLRIADPSTPVRFAQVASMRTNLALVRPQPVARVMDLSAAVYLDRDSVWFTDTRVTLPASHLVGVTGRYAFDAPLLNVTGRADPAALADLRFAYPRLPGQGWARGAARVAWHGRAQNYRVDDLQVVTGTARITGVVGLHLGDSLAVRDTRLRFSGVDTRLVEQVVPGLHLPRQGVMDGSASLDGSLRNATVTADVGFTDARTTRTSHVIATGAVGTDTARDGHRIFRARDLVLTLDSLRISLMRGDLPITGALSGRVHVDGSTDSLLAADADLVHTSRTRVSHFTLTGTAQFAGRCAESQR
jgi:hypothetical protein